MRYGTIISMIGIVISLMIGSSVAIGWDDGMLKSQFSEVKSQNYKLQSPYDKLQSQIDITTREIEISRRNLEGFAKDYQRFQSAKVQGLILSSVYYVPKIALTIWGTLPVPGRLPARMSSWGLGTYNDLALKGNVRPETIGKMEVGVGSKLLEKFGSTPRVQLTGKILGRTGAGVSVFSDVRNWGGEINNLDKMQRGFATNKESMFQNFQGLENLLSSLKTTQQSISSSAVTNIQMSSPIVNDYINRATTRSELISRTLDAYESGYRALPDTGVKSWAFTGPNSSLTLGDSFTSTSFVKMQTGTGIGIGGTGLNQPDNFGMSTNRIGGTGGIGTGISGVGNSGIGKIGTGMNVGQGIGYVSSFPKTSGMGMGTGMSGYGGMGCCNIGSNIGSGGYGRGSSMGYNIGSGRRRY